MQVVLLHETEHGALGQLVNGALADEFLLAVIHSEEEVEDDANHRHEEYHHRPSHRLGRLTVVKYDMDDSDGYQYPHQRHQYHITCHHLSCCRVSSPLCLSL